MGEGRAFRCQTCDEEYDWRLDRSGDAVVSWACDLHLVRILRLMQRQREVTEIAVRRHA